MVELLDGCGETSQYHFILHRFHFLVIPGFNVAFAFKMGDHRTLFRLFMLVVAYFHQRMDHKFEGIDIIIVQDQSTLKQ